MTKLLGALSVLFMATLSGVFTYMTVLTGLSPMPNDWTPAAMQVFSFVILLGAAIAAAAITAQLWRELWTLLRSPRSRD